MTNYFDDKLLKYDKKFLTDVHQIPMFRDILFNTIMGVANSDVEIFLIMNGFYGENQLEHEIIKSYSQIFDEMYKNYNKTENNFEPSFLRKLHISHILVNFKKSIRNVM